MTPPPPPDGIATAEVTGRVVTEMRVPPNDNDAERAVLGGLLIDPEAMAQVRDILQPADFYAERHAWLYRAAVSLSERGEPIDLVTLQNELGSDISRAGGLVYIAELSQATPTAASIRHYADIVVAHALRRRLISAGSTVARLGYDTNMPVSRAIEDAEQTVFAIGQQQRADYASPLAELVSETWRLLEDRLQRNEVVTGVRTNFERLDALTQGLQPGELVVLAARPSVGKTAFALNIARNASVLARVPVAVFSLEMSKQSLTQRLICSEAHVDSYALRTGHADGDAYRRIAQAMDTLMHANLWIDDTPALTIANLRARARRMRKEFNIGLVVVDYLQLMHGGRQESRVQEVSDISSGLKAIAKELGVPVLALSQLSRASEQRENKRPQLSDLRDSGSIEQDADVVMFLYREGMHNKEIERAKTELIVAKNRNGPVDNVNLVFVESQTTFREPAYVAAVR